LLLLSFINIIAAIVTETTGIGASTHHHHHQQQQKQRQW
jgi:hypothetical protein